MGDIFDLFRQIEKPKADKGGISYIIAGLGNPGAEYENTRHNAGFMAINDLAEGVGARIDRAKFRALVSECEISGQRVLLMKPQTYMNLSGEAIAEAASFYKIAPERVIVLCDDISFEPGHLRIRRKGSAGGHNGLKSIIASLGSDAFVRFRIGVGQKPSPEYDLVNWVLGKFPTSDKEPLVACSKNVKAAIELWLLGKEEEALNRYSK